jgi:hypothetical protein
MRRVIKVDSLAKAQAAQAIVHRALGMTFPIVGVNAATGLPAPDCQQGVEYVAIKPHPTLGFWALHVDALITAIRTDPVLRARLTAQQRTAIDAHLDALVDEDDTWFVRAQR